MEYKDFPREARDMIYFLERTVYEAINKREYQHIDVETLEKYLRERWDEYERRFLNVQS